MLKMLVSLALCVFLVFFYFEEKNSSISTFQLTESPAIITKGHYGHSLIVELSYSHQGLEDWIAALREPYPLFLIESEWMMRSPEIIKQLIEKNIEVGLLGSVNEQYEDRTLLEKQLAQFQNTFKQLPLWFATSDYNLTPELQKALYDRGINSIAPSTSITAPNLTLSDGEFISIPLHREQSISFESINEFIQQHPFISIEENIFGYKISTKRYP